MRRELGIDRAYGAKELFVNGRVERAWLSGIAPNVLQFLGRKSGRDGDKLTAAGLTAQPSEQVAAPSFAESELVFECRKIYYQDIDASHFLDSTIELHYPQKDYHRVYFGQILCIRQKA